MTSLNCGRENDLMGFLYDELEPAEKQDFGRHLQNCTGCSSQLASFTDIRETVIEWRNDSLGSSSAAQQGVSTFERRKPSALAAIREFFNLSPLWLKGSVAFASLLFCLLAVLVLARFSEKSNIQPVAATVKQNNLSADEINAKVEQRVKDELQRRETNRGLATIQPNPVSVSPRRVKTNQLVATSSQRNKAGRPLTKVERQELAADLGLIDDGSDSELVLIGDRINQ